MGVPRCRNYVRISGISPEIQIVPFDNNLHNLERAVRERVFLVKNKLGELVPPPRPLEGVFVGRLASSKSLLVKHLPSTVPMNYQHFVDTFKGRKKVCYQRALTEMREQDVSLEEASRVKVFIKYEKTDWTSKRDPVPRVISPRTPLYNLKVGRYLRRIEEPIYKAISKLFGHRTVMKGMNLGQVATKLRQKWEMFNNPVAIGLDASRFDQHVSYEALQFEHQIYVDCFRRKVDKKKLFNILKHQLVNRCVGYAEDGTLKYDVQGTRMSGDMNTSLGNCLLMCLMVKAYSLECGVTCQLANNGDDCVVFMEKADLARFSLKLHSWFLEMGFNMVVEPPCYEFEEIEFCQTKPVYDGVDWVMCRNPITALAKDSVLLQDPRMISGGYLRQWYDAIGTGGIALAGGMPIFDAFYRMFQRSGQKDRRNCRGRLINMNYSEMMPWFMREGGTLGSRVSGAPTAESRSSFYSAFGITPDEQIVLEDYYDSFDLTSNHCEVWYPRSIITS